MLFDSWESLMRVLVVGTLSYIALITLLRLSGKRTLSKMNAFDLIVTIALGSTLATILLNRSVPLADGLLAFTLLIALQYIITWFSVRSATIRQLVKSEPSLLVKDGAFLYDAMRRERITAEEIKAALHAQGLDTITAVSMVILETDGSLSVIPKA